MPFQLSPGVAVVEKDFSSIVPAVSTSAGAFAGSFAWGPVLDPVQISSENQLAERYGKPNDSNFMSFFTAANFLSYTNNLLVVRTDAPNLKNAVAIKTGSVSVAIAGGGTGYGTSAPTITIAAPDQAGGVQATAIATLTGGVVTALTVVGGTGYSTVPTVTIGNPGTSTTPLTVTTTVTTAGVKIKNGETYQSAFSTGQGVTGPWAAKFAGTLGNALTVSIADSASFETWAYKAEFDSAPGTSPAAKAAGKTVALDEMHIIIIDATGAWSGTIGTVLEKFAYVSKAAGAKRVDGSNVYYKDVVNTNSKYIWWTDHVTATGGNALGSTFVNMTQAAFSTLASAYTVTLSGGVDDYTFTDAQAQEGYSLFKNDEIYDVSLIPMGAAPQATVIWALTNLVGMDSAGARKDAIVFCSPQDTLGGVITSQSATAIQDTVTYRNALPSTSYGVMDSGYKYQYDRYNDKYRYVPMNGDIAGLCARTDYTADPWYSPGGFSRGQIKNVIKLAVTPSKTDRDTLYKAGINPIVTFPGQGTVMFGDKTLLSNPSAFDRINVRRLFIVLEKTIATAAKFQLFEFNDGFTRAQFRNLVEPFLRDVQGRRGIVDFRVKCDETNNTGEVIDRNEFAADIFVKPNRSINFITLTFVAARSSVNFDEIGG
jgi:phage tail sheath protein FI